MSLVGVFDGSRGGVNHRGGQRGSGKKLRIGLGLGTSVNGHGQKANQRNLEYANLFANKWKMDFKSKEKCGDFNASYFIVKEITLAIMILNLPRSKFELK